ncbi:MAG: DUF502 domain-containing protein [Natronomonas sp.]|jgi:uncharacterized membrane protein|uniref:DUF502 domain-containing protein n=1 Tax=Natronomonas salsuginis TaxID=2217661 RepID=A0A4U5JBQ3_9EURY|nr:MULTISPECIES: DUF502 domain-containing protein [Natronomonas]MDR9381050.1 DUF502 domain-containing protein [Natronomonas sp.]MDR9430889.1 DUF502 domain-containing protein [Natronomonas sp.]TKR25268.1 DUF502 domain-containing protein [Natronomonas salsuginis]
MLPSSWKRDIASGLIVLVPLLITAYVVAFIYQAIANLPFLETTLGDLPVVVRVLITLVLFGLLILAVGYLMRTTVGDILEATLDGLMNYLPGLRVVYNASKMAVETAVSGPEELQTPVKLETWNGLRMTAFKTGKTTQDGREVLFLPTAPNITTGFVVEVESDRYTEIDESVEDSLTRILSAGFGENRDRGVDIDVTEASLSTMSERSTADEG